jgi:hypothetical protein
VPDVEQGFLVHRLVFEDGEDRFGAIEERMPGLLDVRLRDRIDDLPVCLGSKLFDHGAVGPDSLVAFDRLFRIDAAGEQRLEPGIDARTAEPPLDERVETKGGQVSFVKDDGMPQRDRLLVVRIVREQIEERAGARAIAAIPAEQLVAIHRHPAIMTRKPIACLQ